MQLFEFIIRVNLMQYAYSKHNYFSYPVFMQLLFCAIANLKLCLPRILLIIVLLLSEATIALLQIVQKHDFD